MLHIRNSAGGDNLFWAIIKTDAATTNLDRAFMNALAPLTGHELCEAFTNRDGKGYISDKGCEIGDICELDTSTGNLSTFTYRRWDIEPYWSQWDNSCVHGDSAVSVRRFLQVVNFDLTQGLRALNTDEVGLRYIASRMG